MRIPFWFAMCVLVGLTGFSSLPAAEPVASAFDAANKLYEQGKFTDAALAYEKILQSGPSSSAVYFNLGNARFKAGQIGKAIAAYQLAEKLIPRDPDLRANLRFARNQVQGPTLSPPLWKRWLGQLSVNEWTVLAAVALWLWFLVLCLLQWRPSLKPSLRFYALALGLFVAVSGTMLGVAWSQNRPANSAIVILPEAVVRQGPLDESRTNFTLHDGAEVQVLDRKDDWLQITIDPRRIGWVKRDQVLVAPNI
jgi:tetratricopeptide (TPR) repeat protein